MFWGAGDELGQALPLLPLLEGLRVREPSTNPRRSTIVRLLRGEVATRGTDVSAALAEQLLALIAEQCAVRPTVLVIDDLQWADQASITLWGRLAKSVRQAPLLLVGMMRPVPKREDLLALRRAVADATRLQLTGLAEASVTELVAVLVGGEPEPACCGWPTAPGATSIAGFAKRSLDPNCSVVSDGLQCFASVADAGCAHQVVKTGSGPRAARTPAFKWVNTALGNIKAAIIGTYRAVNSKHVPRYLAEFEYRFNRRYDLAAMIPRLTWAAVRTTPMPYRLLKLAEVYA